MMRDDYSARDLQGDKDDKDDKDNKEDKDATLSPSKGPTQTPTRRPTRRPTRNPTRRPTRTPTARPSSTPTGLPTLDPTLNPAQSPTTEHPTVATESFTSLPTSVAIAPPTELPSIPITESPTSKPTTQYEAKVVGDMSLKVSVYNPNVAVSDADVTLSQGVVESIQEIICETTQLEVYASYTATDIDLCVSSSTIAAIDGDGRKLKMIEGKVSSILKSPFIVVEEGNLGSSDTEYTSWTLKYPVLDISDEFTADTGSSYTDANVKKERSLTHLETSTQVAIDGSIKSGDLSSMIEARYPGTKLSVQGDEVSSFTVVPDLANPVFKMDTNNDANILRIAGISLLAGQIFCTLCLCALAKRRRMTRKSDAATEEEMRGGLKTTEGVEQILAGAHRLRDNQPSTLGGREEVVRVDSMGFDDEPTFLMPSAYAVSR